MRQKLNLWVRDIGIDLVAETYNGDYWAIQCKYHHDPHKNLTLNELRAFLHTARVVCQDKFSTLLAVSSANGYADTLRAHAPEVQYLLADSFHTLGHEFFTAARTVLRKATPKIQGNTDIKPRIELDRTGLAELNNRPPMLLYFAGGRVTLHFGQLEKQALYTYLNNGGLLYASSIREGSTGSFYLQVRTLIEELFGKEGGRFSSMPKNHDVFPAYFEFADGPPHTRSTRRVRSGNRLEIYTLRGRTAVILSDLNLSTRWVDVDAEGHIRALQFGTNLIVFAMTNRLVGDLK